MGRLEPTPLVGRPGYDAQERAGLRTTQGIVRRAGLGIRF